MLESIYGKTKGRTTVNNKSYYYKRNDAYVEILMEKVADLFHLHHAHYTPVDVNGLRYYLSEDLNNYGEFITAYDVLTESTNIHVILDRVMVRYPDDEHLVDDIIRMFFMDLLSLNIDRCNDNWGFLTKDGKAELYLIDNDLGFICNKSAMTTLDNNITSNSLFEVENILRTFPQEYINLFNSMYDTLTVEMLEKLIIETENDLGMELPHKYNYINRLDALRYGIEEIKKRIANEHIIKDTI